MIVVKEVSKNFKEKQIVKQVLNQVSFHVAPYECVGLIGKNGAGKTTLLNILSGILKPDTGFVRVNACKDMMSDFQTLRTLSYVSGLKTQLWSDMKLISSFENCAKMYRIKKEDYVRRLRELTDILDIKDCLLQPVNTLSLGQRVRGELVYALLPKPKVLFLDEATIGLDVSVRKQIMSLLEQMKRQKKTTIIYTSHNLKEIEKICDRVLMLDKGRIIFDGSVERLMKEYASDEKIEMKISGGLPDMEDLPIEKYLIENDILTVQFDRQKVNAFSVIQHIIKSCSIGDIKITEPDLEDTIKKIYIGI